MVTFAHALPRQWIAFSGQLRAAKALPTLFIITGSKLDPIADVGYSTQFFLLRFCRPGLVARRPYTTMVLNRRYIRPSPTHLPQSQMTNLVLKIAAENTKSIAQYMLYYYYYYYYHYLMNYYSEKICFVVNIQLSI
jgi:hypothetical protein